MVDWHASYLSTSSNGCLDSEAILFQITCNGLAFGWLFCKFLNVVLVQEVMVLSTWFPSRGM